MTTETEPTTTDTASTDTDPDDLESGITDLVGDAIGRLSDSARVERVYGDPVTVGDRTVVPVARVAYGFGGGFGSGTDATDVGDVADAVDETDDSEVPESGEGGGIGGGARATPLGALEVTPDGTRFVRFSDSRGKRLAGLVFAVGVGYLLGRLLRRP
jgi:uncharacterized spore protein YtfJ